MRACYLVHSKSLCQKKGGGHIASDKNFLAAWKTVRHIRQTMLLLPLRCWLVHWSNYLVGGRCHCYLIGNPIGQKWFPFTSLVRRLYLMFRYNTKPCIFFSQSVNPYLQGQRLDNVVAKKSVPHFSEEDKDPE